MPSFALLLPVLLFGCADRDSDGDGLTDLEEEDLGTDPNHADSDGDGLSDLEERDAGTDPLSADSDGDGLSDLEETNLGTDPTSVDTDGDGYEDFHEILEGSDPNDAASVIYTGGWPYNPDKNAMDADDPGWASGLEIGAQIPRFVGVDQYGEDVDLYDFANQGKVAIFDLSTSWCGYCQEMAKWLEGEDSFYSDWGPFPTYDIPELISNGTIYWVTVLSQNDQGDPADGATVAAWFEEYPLETVPVLADSDEILAGYMDITGYPSFALLASDLTWVAAGSPYCDSDTWECPVFDQVQEWYDAGEL